MIKYYLYWMFRDLKIKLFKGKDTTKGFYTNYSIPPRTDDQYTWFLWTSFYNQAIRDGQYKNVLELGCWDGRIVDRLAEQNPDVKFTGIDINVNTKHTVAEVKDIPNLLDNFERNLIISKSNFNCYTTKEFEEFVKTCSENNYDIAMIEPTRVFKEEVGYIGEGGVRHYAHDYKAMLEKYGYEIKVFVDNLWMVRKNGEYLAFIYAKKVI